MRLFHELKIDWITALIYWWSTRSLTVTVEHEHWNRFRSEIFPGEKPRTLHSPHTKIASIPMFQIRTRNAMKIGTVHLHLCSDNLQSNRHFHHSVIQHNKTQHRTHQQSCLPKSWANLTIWNQILHYNKRRCWSVDADVALQRSIFFFYSVHCIQQLLSDFKLSKEWKIFLLPAILRSGLHVYIRRSSIRGIEKFLLSILRYSNQVLSRVHAIWSTQAILSAKGPQPYGSMKVNCAE